MFAGVVQMLIPWACAAARTASGSWPAIEKVTIPQRCVP